MRDRETRAKIGRALTIMAGGLLSLFGAASADAQDLTPPQFYEIETKYIFGFTEGSGIGLEGEKEFSIDTIGRFGKRDGRYAATETKFEFEYTPQKPDGSGGTMVPFKFNISENTPDE